MFDAHIPCGSCADPGHSGSQRPDMLHQEQREGNDSIKMRNFLDGRSVCCAFCGSEVTYIYK